jgi:hypothetical protein
MKESVGCIRLLLLFFSFSFSFFFFWTNGEIISDNRRDDFFSKGGPAFALLALHRGGSVLPPLPLCDPTSLSFVSERCHPAPS